MDPPLAGGGSDDDEEEALRLLLLRTGKPYLLVIQHMVDRNYKQVEELLVGYRSHLALYTENEAFSIKAMRTQPLDVFRNR